MMCILGTLPFLMLGENSRSMRARHTKTILFPPPPPPIATGKVRSQKRAMKESRKFDCRSQACMESLRTIFISKAFEQMQIPFFIFAIKPIPRLFPIRFQFVPP